MSRIVEHPIEPEPLTGGPAHHFFGYYETSPWEASGRYILANEADFIDRMPEPADELRVGEPAEAAELLLPDVLTSDGHNSFSPDLQWMLTDDSYTREGGQKLMLVRLADGTRFDMAAIDADHVADRPRRCDLHPRWNRAGTEVCFDAQVAGSRQMYRLDVRPIVRG